MEEGRAGSAGRGRTRPATAGWIQDSNCSNAFRRRSQRPVIFLTARGTTITAIEAMKRSGAADYISKPFELEQMSGLLDRAFEAAREAEPNSPARRTRAIDRILGARRFDS